MAAPAWLRMRTDALDLAYQEHGATDGWPVVLLHGFPYDVHAFDAVVPLLVRRGARVIVPWLRGFGPTRLHTAGSFASGQQAAIGRDLLDLLDGLHIRSAWLAGFDWGNRAACVVAALAPQRVMGLVSCGGYAIQDIAAAARPQAPAIEHRLWYQFYFGTERGRAGLAQDRRGLCELLWRLWSPRWSFGAAEFAATAASFDNPDFVDVVVHSYRHRLGLAPGHARYQHDELKLAALPGIAVPAMVLEGDTDGVAGPPSQQAPGRFTGPHAHRVLEGVGHNLAQEQPEAFAAAILQLHQETSP